MKWKLSSGMKYGITGVAFMCLGLAMSLHASSTHDTSLSCAIEGGRRLGIKLPSEIVIWGIESRDVNTFGEDMTPEVGAAIPCVVEDVLEELQRPFKTEEKRTSTLT